jgi:hypothetical protein
MDAIAVITDAKREGRHLLLAFTSSVEDVGYGERPCRSKFRTHLVCGHLDRLLP